MSDPTVEVPRGLPSKDNAQAALPGPSADPDKTAYYPVSGRPRASAPPPNKADATAIYPAASGSSAGDHGATVAQPAAGTANDADAAAAVTREERLPARDGYSDVLGPAEEVRRPAGDPPARVKRRSPWRWVRRTVLLVLAIVIAIPLVTAARVWWTARQDTHPKSDAIVVLGAAQFNGKPGSVLEWRLVHALKLYKRGVAPRVVTVGGRMPGDNYTEATAAKLWLAARGVPRDNIIAVAEGRDTLQSMKATGREFKRLKLKSAVLVSDPWHALRTRTMARDQGIDAESSPTRSGPVVSDRTTQFKYIWRETGGYLWYITRGR